MNRKPKKNDNNNVLKLSKNAKYCLIKILQDGDSRFLMPEMFTPKIKEELMMYDLIQLNTESKFWITNNKGFEAILQGQIKVYHPLPSDKSSKLGGTASNFQLSIRYGSNSYIAALLEALRNQDVLRKLLTKETDKYLLYGIKSVDVCSKSTVNTLYKYIRKTYVSKRNELPLKAQLEIIEDEICGLQILKEKICKKKI